MLGSLWFNSFSSGGGAAAYELISTTVLGSTAASIDFTGLGTTGANYKHLQLRMLTKNTATGGGEFAFMRFNGDTSANYVRHALRGNGSSVASTSNPGVTSLVVSESMSNFTGGVGQFGFAITDILDFSSTVKVKTMRSLSGDTDPTGAMFISLNSGMLSNSTAAITSLSIYPQFGPAWLAGTRVSLYGLRA